MACVPLVCACPCLCVSVCFGGRALLICCAKRALPCHDFVVDMCRGLGQEGGVEARNYTNMKVLPSLGSQGWLLPRTHLHPQKTIAGIAVNELCWRWNSGDVFSVRKLPTIGVPIATFHR